MVQIITLITQLRRGGGGRSRERGLLSVGTVTRNYQLMSGTDEENVEVSAVGAS